VLDNSFPRYNRAPTQMYPIIVVDELAKVSAMSPALRAVPAFAGLPSCHRHDGFLGFASKPAAHPIRRAQAFGRMRR
jgi:hypothetical protein